MKSNWPHTSIKRVGTRREITCNSNNYLVVTIIRQRINNIQKLRENKPKRWNTSKLKNQRRFSERVKELDRVERGEIGKDMEGEWKSIRSSMLKAAKLIGEKKNRTKYRMVRRKMQADDKREEWNKEQIFAERNEKQ